MLQTEYIRSLQSNYERVLLDRQPEEKRYQYCILGRGGIKSLLACSLRYINGLAYLYYDITSKQNITQIFGKKCIDRKWLKDFMWSFGQVQMELKRFLLDEHNVLWFPEQIFQDLESNIFSFLYLPYYEGEENSFLRLLEYLVDHIDYEDEVLVECVYKMYEQCEKCGEVYLQEQIFQDTKMLNQSVEIAARKEAKSTFEGAEHILTAEQKGEASHGTRQETRQEAKQETRQEAKQEARQETGREEIGQEQTRQGQIRQDETRPDGNKTLRRGIRNLWDGRRRRYQNKVSDYQESMQQAMENGFVPNNAVAEETVFEEEYGKTIYIEETGCTQERIHRLYAADGRILMQLEKENCIIGKKKGEADLILDDFSVSRMHARISREEGEMHLEDLNSTNGTFKNGLRLQPYEKRKLEEGDEIRIGKVVLIYR